MPSVLIDIEQSNGKRITISPLILQIRREEKHRKPEAASLLVPNENKGRIEIE